MTTDKISIRNVKNVTHLDVRFEYPGSSIIVLTGRNGVGKTTIIKAFKLPRDPNIFGRFSGDFALREGSLVEIELDGYSKFTFTYNGRLKALDTKDGLPDERDLFSELPIPFGDRFSRFSTIAGLDSELKISIASSDYKNADGLIRFLSEVYSSRKFDDLKQARIKGNTYYFILKGNDYYIREDHFSSGEYFLIQLYRLVTSGAKLILIDEVDVALDAVAQANLYSALRPLLQVYDARIILVSHSLEFMSTVDDGGLYYLEECSGTIKLEQYSFGYVKSDLFGFKGYDRYFLTEDEVLEGFVEYLLKVFPVSHYYQHTTIGVNGANQLQKLVEKNDRDQIFLSSENVICIVDGDVFPQLRADYDGPTLILCSPVNDIEVYIFDNRDSVLPDVDLPTYTESTNVKKASKAYWKYLTVDQNINKARLYGLIVDSEPKKVRELVQKISDFLTFEGGKR
ncbi:AAA family ATPase [Microbulbifer taiwanensis]|uniref:AAA family ATPase n=1 Tax=Microbulbifer taiwanensis TaxID=986746 RepID=A0ABW1YSM3_9GAMM|nr:AAA family ATPase [Microbulbifer taiwanensis]